MKKRSILSLIALLAAFGSYFLPYLEKESYQYDNNLFLSSAGPELVTVYQSGIELGFPLIAFPVFLATLLLLLLGKGRAANIVALVLACVNVLTLPIILFGLHFQLFSSTVRTTGIGYYVLVLSQALLLGVTIYNAARPSRLVKKPAEELLDEVF